MVSKRMLSIISIISTSTLMVVLLRDLELGSVTRLLGNGHPQTQPLHIDDRQAAATSPATPAAVAAQSTDFYHLAIGSSRTAWQAMIDGTIANISPVHLRQCYPPKKSRALFQPDAIQLEAIQKIVQVNSNLTGGAPRNCIVGPYDRDFNHVASRLRDVNGPGFAYVRYADGELGVAQGKEIGNGEWYYRTGEGSQLQKDLVASLRGHFGQEFYYGFASPSDDSQGLRWFLERTEQGCGYISYANIWVNAHYPKTQELLKELTEKVYYKKIVLVVNQESVQKVNATRDWAVDYVPLPDNIPGQWETPEFRTALIKQVEDMARKYDGHLFIVSGGPPGKILATKMWEANCRNKYVDFGSSVDPFLRDKTTRAYHDPSNGFSTREDVMWHVPIHQQDPYPVQYA